MGRRTVLWITTTLLVMAGAYFRAVMAAGFEPDGTFLVSPSWWVGALGLLLVVAIASTLTPRVVAICRGRWAVGLLSVMGLLLLALPLLGPLGDNSTGARVGIRLPLLGSVQLVPASLVLLTLAAAVTISRWPDDTDDGVRRYLGIGVLAGVAVLMLARADDYGPALVLMAAVGLVALAGGRRTAPLLFITLVGGAAGGLVGSSSTLVQRRIREWLVEGGDETTQVAWSLVVEAGWAGSGFRFGRADDIALAANDLSLLALVELGGLVSLVAFAAAWLVLLGAGTMVATHVDDADRRVIATGIVSLLAAKLAIALLMQAGVMPLSGLTTPLLSVGYSTLLVDAATVGVLIGLARPTPLFGEAAQRQLHPQVATYFALAAIVASVLVLDLRNDGHLNPELVNRRNAIAQQAQQPIISADGQLLSTTDFLPSGRPHWRLEADDALPVVGFISPRARPRGMFSEAPHLTRCRQPGWQTWRGNDGCDPVAMSVSLTLQSELMDTMRGFHGAGATAVILTPSGQVLAAGSSFDPPDVESLLSGPEAGDYEPAAFSLTGPPGSTIKPLIGALAHPYAEQLNLPITRTVTLRGGYQVSSWQSDGCGEEFNQAMQGDSCNPTSIMALEAIGYETFVNRAAEIGYGRDISGPGVPVAISLLPDAEDPVAQLAAIGQGSTRVTVAQQALLAATLAANGRAPSHLSIVGGPAPTLEALDQAGVTDTIEAMTHCATSGKCGEGLTELAFPVAAKTGTAQQPDAGNLGWCLALAPADAPRVAAAIRLDPTQGEHASGRQACDLLSPLLSTALELTP